MDALLQSFLAVVLPTVGTLVGVFAVAALRMLMKRWGLEASVTETQAIREAVRSAIAGAEEWAARQTKTRLDAVSGEEKARWVIERVKDKWPNVTSTDLSRMVDEELGSMVGVGATGNNAAL